MSAKETPYAWLMVAIGQGELRIPFEDSWVAANPTIVFSEMPRKIGLAFQ